MTVDSRLLLELWDTGRTASPSDLDWLGALQTEFPAFALPYLLTAYHTREAEPNTHEGAIKAAAVRIPQRERLFERLHLPLARPFDPLEEVPQGPVVPIPARVERPTEPEDPMEAARRKVRLILEENRRMRDRAALKADELGSLEKPVSTTDTRSEAPVIEPDQIAAPEKNENPRVPIAETVPLNEDPGALPEPPFAEPADSQVEAIPMPEFSLAEKDEPLAAPESEVLEWSDEEIHPKSERAEMDPKALKMSLEEWLRRIEAEELIPVIESRRPLEIPTAAGDRGTRDKKRKEKKKKKLNKKERKRDSAAAPPKPKRQKEQFDLIDQFIEKLPELRPEKTILSEETSRREFPSGQRKEVDGTEGLMTETLAELYFAQKHYTLALEAYEILLLRFPEKSSFFAARISELRKRLETPRL